MICATICVQTVAIAIGITKHPILVAKSYGFSTYKLFGGMPTKILHHGPINTQVLVKDSPLSKLGIQINIAIRGRSLYIPSDLSIDQLSAK